MIAAAPHYLLFSEARGAAGERCEGAGRWRFSLQAVDGRAHFAVEETEEEVCGDRLELLAVVRGLEALDQPSRVTLVTRSEYVIRGIRFGIDQWRECGWRWERDGRLIPIKNADLWQRIDHAMKYHDVQMRTWRFDSPHATLQPAALPAGRPRQRRGLWSRLTRMMRTAVRTGLSSFGAEPAYLSQTAS